MCGRQVWSDKETDQRGLSKRLVIRGAARTSAPNATHNLQHTHHAACLNRDLFSTEIAAGTLGCGDQKFFRKGMQLTPVGIWSTDLYPE